MNYSLIIGLLLWVFVAVPVLTYLIPALSPGFPEKPSIGFEFLVRFFGGHLLLTPLYAIILIIWGLL